MTRLVVLGRIMMQLIIIVMRPVECAPCIMIFLAIIMREERKGRFFKEEQ